MRAPSITREEVTEQKLRSLLDVVYHRYHHDFRDYSLVSLKRRVGQAMAGLGWRSVEAVEAEIAQAPESFARLLSYLTVPVSDMFRDPHYFRALREQVVPRLRELASIKIWVAGCCTGEEAYSLAVLLREEGLLERSLLYATDIDHEALRRAQAGVYPLDRVRQFSENHLAAGGKRSLSEHYEAAHGSVTFAPAFKKHLVFSDHSLATDSVFSEVQLVSCRNVLIYFNPTLQQRALALFDDALSSGGFLGLGARETLRPSPRARSFEAFSPKSRIWRKKS